MDNIKLILETTANTIEMFVLSIFRLSLVFIPKYKHKARTIWGHDFYFHLYVFNDEETMILPCYIPKGPDKYYNETFPKTWLNFEWRYKNE